MLGNSVVARIRYCCDAQAKMRCCTVCNLTRSSFARCMGNRLGHVAHVLKPLPYINWQSLKILFDARPKLCRPRLPPTQGNRLSKLFITTHLQGQLSWSVNGCMDDCFKATTAVPAPEPEPIEPALAPCSKRLAACCNLASWLMSFALKWCLWRRPCSVPSMPSLQRCNRHA